MTSAEYPKWFYLQSILSHFPEFQRIAKDKATTMGHMQAASLDGRALRCAGPHRMIAQVDGVFAGLLERQVANEVANRTLVILRDALLPKLLSGELRLDGLEPVSVQR